MLTNFISSNSRCNMVLRIQDRDHVLATKNPNLLKATTQFSSIIHTHPTTIHNHITINPLRSLRTINSKILSLGEIQNILNLRCTISLTRPQIGRELTGINIEVTPTDHILAFDDEACSRGELNDASTLTGLQNNETWASLSGPIYSLNSAQTQPPLCLSDQAQNSTQPSTGTSSQNQFISIQAQQQQTLTDKYAELHGHNSTLRSKDLSAQTITDHADAQYRQSKQTGLPTRRSQRILEKRTAIGAQQNKKKRTKTQASMIQFDKDSLQTPLDTGKALQILQSTGLIINKQIEDLIEEVVKKDQEMGNADTPTTPLHDPIPPFAIPGTDLLL